MNLTLATGVAAVREVVWRRTVTTCGSGITAAIITLALHSLGHENNTLYDGSWSEWGARDDTPVVTGRG